MKETTRDEGRAEQGLNQAAAVASVIGIGLRLPRASDLKGMYGLLQSTQSWSGKLGQTDTLTLDSDFFKISPDEAYECSPLLGPLLEVVTECIMDSGLPFKDVNTPKTGFYLQTNVPDTYRNLTTKVVNNFELKGPVVDFAGLDVSPVNMFDAMLCDFSTGRTNLAIVAGVFLHGSSQPGCEHKSCDNDRLHRDATHEGIVAILIKSPKFQSPSVPRWYLDILSFGLLDNGGTTVQSEENCSQSESEGFDFGIFHILRGEAEDGRDQKGLKLCCSETVQEMFRSSHSISVLVGIVSCIACMFLKDYDNTDSMSHANRAKYDEDQVMSVVCGNLRGLKHQLLIRKPKTATRIIDTVNLAAVIPIIVHPLANTDDAERALWEYENEPGFLQFLANSELSKGLKGPQQEIHYFFKVPGFSHFSKTNFIAYGEMPVIVVFEDFLLSPWKPSADILNLHVIERSITLFDQILQEEEASFSVLKILKSGTIPSPTSTGGITSRAAVQMAVVDLLTSVNSKNEIHKILATGLGSIAASYADDALTFPQGVKVAHAIELAVRMAKKKLKGRLIMDVFCSSDEVYQLGPWVRILGHFPQGVYRIAAPPDKRNNVIDTIRSKGFAHEEYPIHLPVFSPVFRSILSNLGRSLLNIIPMPAMWSPKVDILGTSSKDITFRRCSSAFFVEMLCTPFNSDLEIQDQCALSSKLNKELPDPGTCEAIKEAMTNNQTRKKPIQLLLAKKEKLVSTPLRELDGNQVLMNCSTNAMKGSFLCPSSLQAESVSSISETATENTSGSPPQTQKILQESVAEEKKKRLLYLYVFSSKKRQADKSEENSSKTESSSGNSTFGFNVEPVHKSLEASQSGLLECLAWIHGTGNCMKSENQFCDSPEDSPYYQGDFVMKSFWAWNRETFSSVSIGEGQPFNQYSMEHGTLYPLSPKPRLKETVLLNLINSRSLSYSIDNMQQAHPASCGKFICTFDLSLLLLSGYKWMRHLNQLVPVGCMEMAGVDLKMQKQVRFSYNKASHEVVLKDGEKSVGHINLSYLTQVPLNEEFTDAPHYGFANSGDLLAALNRVRTEEFNFVSMLQVDESLERYLMDILVSFPFSSSLHVFITPKLLATCVSKYVINISRKASRHPVNEEICVLLRDRSTDQTEICSSITKALSIISSFEEALYNIYLSRVFEIPTIHPEDTFTFARLEFMIFDKEREVARLAYLDKENDASSSSSSSSSSYEMDELFEPFNDESDCVGHSISNDGTNENMSSLSSHSQQEGPREESSPQESSHQESLHENSSRSVHNESPLQIVESLNTSFCLNFDDTFIQTFHKLAKINKHTIAYIHPKVENKVPAQNDGIESSVTENGLENSETGEKLPKNLMPGVVEVEGTSRSTLPVYMISVKELTGTHVFMYCKRSREISRWNDIKEIVSELKMKYPDMTNTHQVHVTKFDDEEFSFEELLHAFMYGSRHTTPKNLPEEKAEGEKDVCGLSHSPNEVDINDNKLCISPICNGKQNGSSSDLIGQDMTDAQTPYVNKSDSFVIPQIVISPPEPCAWEKQDSENNFQQPKHVDQSTCSEDQVTINLCSTPMDTLCEPVKTEFKSHHPMTLESKHLNGIANGNMINHETPATMDETNLSVEYSGKIEGTESFSLSSNSCQDSPKHVNNSKLDENVENDDILAVKNSHNSPERKEVTTGITTNESNELCKENEQNSLEKSPVKMKPADNGCNEDISNQSDQRTISVSIDSVISRQSDDNSNKENATYCVDKEKNEMNDIFKALKKPRNEGLEFMAQFKVTKALVIHLTDQISSFQEQKGRAAGNLLMYIAKGIVDDDQEHRKNFLGLVLFDDMDVCHSRFRVPDNFNDSNLESALNCLLSWYILKVVADLTKANASRTSAIVQSPIQRDSASLMLVASHLGCERVITCSSVEEIKEDLLEMVPRSVVLDDEINTVGVLPLVGKKGVDVIVMLRQQEIGKMLSLLAPSGCLILCGDVNRTQEIDMSMIPQNGKIAKVDALSGVRYVTSMLDEEKAEFEVDLNNLLGKQISFLNEYYPSAREGYFYGILGHIYTSSLDEQPLENVIHDMFFSTTSTLQQVIEDIPICQRKIIQEIYTLMAMPIGDDSDADFILENLLA